MLNVVLIFSSNHELMIIKLLSINEVVESFFVIIIILMLKLFVDDITLILMYSFRSIIDRYAILNHCL